MRLTWTQLGKRATAERGKVIDPVAATQLVENSFVDDVGGGGPLQVVLRMRGNKDPQGEYDGTIA